MAGWKFNPDEYVNVHERIADFRERHPEGFINTDVQTVDYGDNDWAYRIVVRVYRNAKEVELGMPASTGVSESFVDPDADKTLEKTETTAIGRALAILGFSAKKGIASREEMEHFKEKKERVSKRSSRDERKVVEDDQENYEDRRESRRERRNSSNRRPRTTAVEDTLDEIDNDNFDLKRYDVQDWDDDPPKRGNFSKPNRSQRRFN